MHALFVLVFAIAGLCIGVSPPTSCHDGDSPGIGLLQQKRSLTTLSAAQGQANEDQDEDQESLKPWEIARGKEFHLFRPRYFLGASPIASVQPCVADTYQPSPVESQWAMNVLNWTGESHCNYMSEEQATKWTYENEHGGFDTQLFSTICRTGKVPQFIEPLAGILRDPRYGCYGRSKKEDLFSVDWLVFPDEKAVTTGSKSRFYDAGGSTFHEALEFLLETYRGHGISFDEVYVWEVIEQGRESYWKHVSNETRAFWEPKLTFYDGVGVTEEQGSMHNPVHRIFSSCAPEDFCAFKLDIDMPKIEQALINQFLNTPGETTAKLDEVFFEHHVAGVMQDNWGTNVMGTFADSYRLFGDLRRLGVRAHSWV